METADAPIVRFDAPGSMIWADGLSLGYGERPVLSSVRLSVQGGEICGFRGPNGSGKSTFLKACLGLLRPMGGSLRVLGLPPGGRRFRSILRRIGYVPQQKPPGAIRVTVREAVSMGRFGIVGLGRPLRPEDRQAVESAMATAGVLDLAEVPVQELSGGQYQRTNIARALAMDPSLLILDEPSTHLDAQGRNDVVGLLADLARARQASMVLASHDGELLGLCDRLYEFGGGTVGESLRAPR